MQAPMKSKDYYDPYNPFGDTEDDTNYNPDNPFGSSSVGVTSDKPTNTNSTTNTNTVPKPSRPNSHSQTSEYDSGGLSDDGYEFESNNSNPTNPTTPSTPPTTTPDTSTPTTPPATPTKPDTSSWNDDGYGKPQHTATSFGNAPAGWDQKKWTDPNHQTPKYVVGRIVVSNGDMKDPVKRAQAIADIQKAYPGATYNGKDIVTIPGVGDVDVFQGASAGVWAPAWQPAGGGGGGTASFSATPNPASGMPPLPQSATEQTTRSEYNSLLRQYLRRQMEARNNK